MNRDDLQQLAEIRLQEAENLFTAGLYAGAYYLAGYVVECALKACIAKNTQQYDFPDKDTVNRSFSHNLDQLVAVSGLKSTLATETQIDPIFADNWATVRKWKESARYKRVSSIQ